MKVDVYRIGGSQIADVCAELCDASEANHREA